MPLNPSSASGAPVTTPSSPLGIILFAHGSRDTLWRLPIEAVAEQVRTRCVAAAPAGLPAVQVCCAYLELCSPDLMQAATELIASGARTIRVFPLFLGVGRHAREDLPVLMAELASAHPDVTLELLPTAGENPALVNLLADLALS